MSTKNLARTVIEGGRAHYNQFERWHSNAVARAHAHKLEHTLRSSVDVDVVVFEPRKPVRRSFSDKLGPARRWLRSQVGRPWNNVMSDLFQRFDIRTTAGRHIVFCHLLTEVSDDEPRSRYGGFYLDAHGILRYRGRQGFNVHWRQRLPEPEADVCAWLAGRRVLEHGERLYWLELTAHGAFRQRHELSAGDVRRFKALPGWFHERITGPLRLDLRETRALSAQWS